MKLIDIITLGGGCFWCTEAAFNEIEGVRAVTPGYSGGHTDEPTYEQVSSGATGHAEVINVTFDTRIITLKEILEIFWAIHDPTTKDRQGNDVGSQYRSIILYRNEEQHQTALTSIKEVQKLWEDPVVTEVVPFEAFYPAEAYHQNYFANNGGAPYCQIVINPKLQKLRQKFAARLKQSV